MSYLHGENVACAIISFDRPGYLKETLDALYRAKESEHVDFHLFQDGVKDRFGADKVWGSVDGVRQSVDVAKKHDITFADIHRYEHNYDIMLMKNLCHGLFHEYDSVIFMENDLVVGENYLQNLWAAHQQFPKASVTMYHHNSQPQPKSWVQKFLHARLWGYMFGLNVWHEIRTDWRKLVSIFEDVRYRDNREAQLSENDLDKVEKICGCRSHCHDIILSSLIMNSGFSKIRPITSRAEYIGKHGHHAYNEDYWERKEMEGRTQKIEHEVDPVNQWAISGNKRANVSGFRGSTGRLQ